jgi:hypothetical protein
MHQLRAARRQARGRAMRGQTSNQDQDLLRAMLVFACAGLDAAVKALIEDSLPTLADRNPDVQLQLEAFAEKRVSQVGGLATGAVARLLAHPVSPREGLLEDFVQELTGGSLQSVDQLHRVRAALGIEDPPAIAAITSLRGVFKARNEISHEMDLNPITERRVRRHRGIRETVSMADRVFAVGCDIVAYIVTATRDAEAHAGS